MELRHLRYFVAVAEEGSLTVAADKRLHTSQPSLSRQIRDLEYEVGVSLLKRSVHGVELTPAGKAFLDHARLALIQVEAARVVPGALPFAIEPEDANRAVAGQQFVELPRFGRLQRNVADDHGLVGSYTQKRIASLPGRNVMAKARPRRGN